MTRMFHNSLWKQKCNYFHVRLTPILYKTYSLKSVPKQHYPSWNVWNDQNVLKRMENQYMNVSKTLLNRMNVKHKGMHIILVNIHNWIWGLEFVVFVCINLNGSGCAKRGFGFVVEIFLVIPTIPNIAGCMGFKRYKHYGH